jgi:hypothetical protein
MIPVAALTVRNDIVKVTHGVDIFQVAEDRVNEVLEDGRRVSYTKWHDQELKRAKPGPYARIGDVFVPDPDLVVARQDIEGKEVDSTLKAADYLVHS